MKRAAAPPHRDSARALPKSCSCPRSLSPLSLRRSNPPPIHHAVELEVLRRGGKTRERFLKALKGRPTPRNSLKAGGAHDASLVPRRRHETGVSAAVASERKVSAPE